MNGAVTWRIQKKTVQQFFRSRQVAGPFAVYVNGKESFNPILHPDADQSGTPPNHP